MILKSKLEVNIMTKMHFNKKIQNYSKLSLKIALLEKKKSID